MPDEKDEKVMCPNCRRMVDVPDLLMLNGVQKCAYCADVDEEENEWQEDEYLRCPACNAFIDPECGDEGDDRKRTVRCPVEGCHAVFEYGVHTTYQTRKLKPSEVEKAELEGEVDEGRLS
jgi:DNA-directed RNA polymerase subunit RPC12/RpoP